VCFCSVRASKLRLMGVASQCWAVNCKGNMHLLREALPTFNANAEGGVFLMTSSIAVGSKSIV